MKSETIQLYDNNKLVTLTTYICEPDALNGIKRGAVIVCPGGAYIELSDTEGEPVALKFNSMGYQAFVLRYTVYSETGNYPPLNEKIVAKEEKRHPAPMRDIGKAMIYIKEHANEWQIDENKIALCGFSAGAHNCAMYSVYWNQPIIKDYFGVDSNMLRPAAAVLGYGVFDYTFLMEKSKKEESDDVIADALFTASLISFLGTVQPDPSTVVAVSPPQLVNSDTPPMFIWTTSEDNMVDAEHSTRMATGLAKNKIPFEIHVFEEGPHGLSLSNTAVAKGKNLIYPDAAKWVDLAGAWLEKRFAPEIPDVFTWNGDL